MLSWREDLPTSYEAVETLQSGTQLATNYGDDLGLGYL